MNRQVVSMLKGMFIVPIIFLLICALFYGVNWIYPETFLPTFITRMFTILPAVGIVAGGLLGWVGVDLSKEERGQLAVESLILLGLCILTNSAWGLLFGKPQDEETKVARQLLTTIASVIVWSFCLKFMRKSKQK